MRRIAILGAVVLLSAGCSDAEPDGETGSTPAPSGSPVQTGEGTPCPNPLEDGGSCLGELEAGRSYTTREFDPPITYSVPTPGWRNYEDLYGNFQLTPPGQPVEGVDANTSDFIGVYRGLTPSRTVGPRCHEVTTLEPGETPTVPGMWRIYTADPLLEVTPPEPVSVGGLEGMVADIRLRPGAELPSCRDGGKVIRLAGLFSGASGSAVAHSIVPGLTMRLYLLEDRWRVLGIEVRDVTDAPASMEELTAVAEALRFST